MSNNSRPFPDKAAKTLQNKLLDGGTADNQHQIILPKNTTANLAAISNETGSIAYDTTLGSVVVNTGAGFVSVSEDSPNQASNSFYAGPTSGSPAAPAFRALVTEDIPVLTSLTVEEVTLTNSLSASVSYSEIGHSFQVIAPDLELSETAGSNTGTDPKFLAAVMGNILGDDVDGVGNYLGGVIGANSLTDPSTDYPNAGVMGIIMDASTGADGAVVAVIDGSDPSSVTRARAAFAVRMNNNNAGSGCDYGVDLKDAGNPYYTGGGKPFAVANAEIRMSTDVCILTGAGAPVNGTTGKDFAGPGSSYTDYTNKIVYLNSGTIGTPAWSPMIPYTYTKYTLGFADFTSAGASKTVTIASLPIKAVVWDVIVHTTTAFSGGTVSGLAADIGNALDGNAYIGSYDLMAAVSGTNFDQAGFGLLDFSSAHNLTITVTATDDTLDHLAAGSVDIYFKTEQLL